MPESPFRLKKARPTEATATVLRGDPSFPLAVERGSVSTERLRAVAVGVAWLGAFGGVDDVRVVGSKRAVGVSVIRVWSGVVGMAGAGGGWDGSWAPSRERAQIAQTSGRRI